MGRDNVRATQEDARAAVAATVEAGQDVRWNHLRTIALVMAVLALYFCELLVIVGGGFLAPSIAAVIGGAELAAWPSLAIILFTVALGGPISQASDYWGRKWFLVIPNVLGIVGAIIAARASTMGMYIAGFCIGGIAFGSQGLFLAIVSEVLPREYRSWSQAAANLVNALGSIFSLSAGGYLIESGPEGFWTYFYICAAIYTAAVVLCILLYNPVPRELQVTLTFGEKVRALDWIAYAFLTSGTVLFCLGLSWAQRPYPWHDVHVLAPFLVGGVLLIFLAIYAWKFKKDGLFHHALFRDRNYIISLVALFVEGLSYMAAGLFFPATLAVVQSGNMSPYRQALCYMVGFVSFAACSLATGYYIYKAKTVRFTGILTFVAMLLFFATMASVTATTKEANFWGYVNFFGLGIGLAFVTFVTSAQFATTPELIAVTTGLLISVRSLGGSIGVAIFGAISASGYSNSVVSKVSNAVVPLGLAKMNVNQLISALATGDKTLVQSIAGVTPDIVAAAGMAMTEARVVGFRGVYICGGVFSIIGIVAAAFLRNPSAEFNAMIDAPVELPQVDHLESKAAVSEQRIESKEIRN